MRFSSSIQSKTFTIFFSLINYNISIRINTNASVKIEQKSGSISVNDIVTKFTEDEQSLFINELNICFIAGNS